MPKRRNQSKAPVEVDDADSVLVLSPLGLLKPISSRSNKPRPDLESWLIDNCYLPDTANIVVPTDPIKADFYHPDWVCMHDYPFKIGFQLPFPPLVRRFLEHFQVAPCQVMPLAWRILHSAYCIKLYHGVNLDLEELSEHYIVHVLGGGRITFKRKEGVSAMFLDIEQAADRKWMETFFFVERSSLGAENAYLLSNWKVEGLYWGSITRKADTPALLAAHFALDVRTRTYRVPVPHAVVESDPESEAEPEPEPEPIQVDISEAKPIISEPNMSTGSKKSGATTSASSMIERMKRRSTTTPVNTPAAGASSGAGGSVSNPISIPTRPPVIPATVQAGKKRKLMVEVPDDFFAGNPGSAAMLSQALQLPPYAVCREKAAVSDLAGDLASRSLEDMLCAMHIRNQSLKLETDVSRLEQELHTATKANAEHESKIKMLESKNSALETSKMDAENKVAKLKDEFQELKGQLETVAGYFSWKSKLETIEEFTNGKHADWNLEKERADFQNAFPVLSPLLAELDAVNQEDVADTASTVPSTVQENVPANK